MTRVGVVVFPGSNCDADTVRGVELAGGEPVVLWHESADLQGVSAVILPGGFAYGDYIRAGVIARFSPVMRSVAEFAGRGGLVLGICNGFQVLAEAGLVPGALLRNSSLQFVGRTVRIAATRADSPFTRGVAVGRPLEVPVAHGEGCYYAEAATLDELERSGGVLFHYVGADGHVADEPTDADNPNGSLRGIAGVTNLAGNVAGLMPHPERAAEALLGSADGLPILRSLVASAAEIGPDPPARAGRGRMSSSSVAPIVAPDSDAHMTSAAVAPAAAPQPLHRQLGLTDEELDGIRARLHRDPNDLELAIFSVMWSEHCSYKSSKPLLRTLPTAGEGVVAGPGENAGVISIGDGLAVAFKIESHNHPSAVEPYQGAATGVGGILRDIFTMGARPIAVLDALRFGDPSDPRTRHLVNGVVHGVGGYGNCVGVPTVGGELVFDTSYQANPLVNVMAIGLLDESRLTLASAPGPGNLVVLFGSATGRDGIGGASVLASATFSDDDPSKRPSVQVGDPFAEKLLIEASLELIERGLVVGLQDLGAGGISCATSETADRAGTGIRLDLDAVPRREPGMAPFEVMISESQERMLAVVEPANEAAVRAICTRWGLPCAVIGVVTEDGDLTIVDGGPDGTEIARIPAAALTSDAIVFDRVGRPPVRRRAAPALGVPDAPHRELPDRGMDPGLVLLGLLGSANLASRRWVFEQYDSTVQTNTVVGPGHGAAVLRVKGTSRAIVATTDGNQGISGIDPRLGAAMSVAEATRNVSITGARPLGVTNCLNYGDPTRPEAFWQLSEAVAGLGDACRALGVPVTGGNVSLYNESPLGAIAPTPEIGVVGLLEDVDRLVGPAFVAPDDAVVLVGEATSGLGGSEYARLAGATGDEPPDLDLSRERALQRFIREAIERGLVESAQDVAGGGLGVALAECAIWGGMGAHLRLPVGGSPAVELFGESPSRLVVTCRPRHAPALLLLARQFGLPTHELGRTGGDRLVAELAGEGATGAAEARGSRIADAIDVPIADLRHAWEHGLPRALGLEQVNEPRQRVADDPSQRDVVRPGQPTADGG